MIEWSRACVTTWRIPRGDALLPTYVGRGMRGRFSPASVDYRWVVRRSAGQKEVRTCPPDRHGSGCVLLFPGSRAQTPSVRRRRREGQLRRNATKQKTRLWASKEGEFAKRLEKITISLKPVCRNIAIAQPAFSLFLRAIPDTCPWHDGDADTTVHVDERTYYVNVNSWPRAQEFRLRSKMPGTTCG